MFKRLKALIFLALILSVIVTGCGETTAPEKMDPESGAETNEVQTQEVFSVGETVKMGDLQFSVNDVRTSAGDDFFKPEQGNVYFIVDSTISNLASESANISSLLMFKLVDDEGYNYQVTLGPDTRGSLDGELGPGRKMRGELAFEVPENVQGLELIFEPNVFGFGQAIYKVK